MGYLRIPFVRRPWKLIGVRRFPHGGFLFKDLFCKENSLQSKEVEALFNSWHKSPKSQKYPCLRKQSLMPQPWHEQCPMISRLTGASWKRNAHVTLGCQKKLPGTRTIMQGNLRLWSHFDCRRFILLSKKIMEQPSEQQPWGQDNL